MAVNEDLAKRIRSMVVLDPRVTEKRMFGGVAFLLDGRILVSARRTGTMLVQCGEEAAVESVKEAGVTAMVMAGRPSRNFIDVANDSLETEEGLQRWITLAEHYVATLPPQKR